MSHFGHGRSRLGSLKRVKLTNCRFFYVRRNNFKVHLMVESREVLRMAIQIEYFLIKRQNSGCNINNLRRFSLV